MKIGIMGGSGLEDAKLLENYEEIEANTPYGFPSSKITCGKLKNAEICFISRHGKKHEITPSKVNNRANIYALSKLGCTHIIATTAVGSLRETIERGDFVILDQFIDFTRHRELTFFENFENGAKHISMAEPFSNFLREKIIKACQETGIKFHQTGTVVSIEGPRFSTRAESKMFRLWGADVINMSIAQEAILAKEMGIEYAAIAMSTDYDCWKIDEEAVSWEAILGIFTKNADKMKLLLFKTIDNLANEDEDKIKSLIRTIPDFPKQGIMFRDITTLLKNPEGFKKVIDILEERYKDKEIEAIAGIESRGFIIASCLALRLKKSLVLIRKPGKLPAEKIREEYDLEYGKDSVEIHKDALNPGDKVVIIDDLIATGGTVLAASKLIENLGAKVEEAAFIVELEELEGRKKLEEKAIKVFSIAKYSA